MSKLDYTEFTFGFAFTHNLISYLPSSLGAPVFPNLRQENSLGWDVCINLPGCPLFFQFKLPELMKTRGAGEFKTDTAKAIKPPDGIELPIFRIQLLEGNQLNQHNRLVRLQDEGQFAYYVTPAMKFSKSFDNAYINGRVPCCSFLFSPKAISQKIYLHSIKKILGNHGQLVGIIKALNRAKFTKNIDHLCLNEKHTIAYRCKERKNLAWLFPERCKIPVVTCKDVKQSITDALSHPDSEPLKKTAKKILNTLERIVLQSREDDFGRELDERKYIIDRNKISAIKNQINEKFELFVEREQIYRPARDTLRDLLIARDIAFVFFGAEMLVAQPPDCREEMRLARL